ncbi:MAG: hypothetical protein ACFFB0_08565 [Promethearchaeota archaeon]
MIFFLYIRLFYQLLDYSYKRGNIIIVSGKIKNKAEVKRKAKKPILCPLCQEKIEIGVENSVVKDISLSNLVYFPHIHIHGNPLHALICYLNSKLETRNIGIIKSIEISRDSDTLKQVMNKWTNPY